MSPQGMGVHYDAQIRVISDINSEAIKAEKCISLLELYRNSLKDDSVSSISLGSSSFGRTSISRSHINL